MECAAVAALSNLQTTGQREIGPMLDPARLRGRSRFGAAKARASTFFVPKAKAWMAGSSPAMTMWID